MSKPIQFEDLTVEDLHRLLTKNPYLRLLDRIIIIQREMETIDPNGSQVSKEEVIKTPLEIIDRIIKLLKESNE